MIFTRMSSQFLTLNYNQLHPSHPARYEGPQCNKCAKKGTYEDAFGACLACEPDGGNHTGSGGGAAQKLSASDAALLWLALALALIFCAVFLIVFLIQRRQGGSLMGGLFRAMDFFCYLVILLQTTLYIANGTVKNTMDAVLNEFTEERHRFIKSFFRSISVIQLDFSGAVKLPCLGGDPLSFEKTYAALTCLVVLVYVAALLLLPRLRLFKGALAYIGLSKARNHLVLLYQQFAYRVGTWLVLTHAVSLKVSLGDKNWADDPAWAFLFLIHCIGFPLAILFGAMHVRTTMLGGTCCHDMPETMARHNSNVRATGELGLWRYYLDYDYKARFHWFRAANMAVLLTIVGSETSIRPPAAANEREKGEYDLSRTCIQAAAVLIYLLLLLIYRPYVRAPQLC